MQRVDRSDEIVFEIMNTYRIFTRGIIQQPRHNIAKSETKTRNRQKDSERSVGEGEGDVDSGRRRGTNE